MSSVAPSVAPFSGLLSVLSLRMLVAEDELREGEIRCVFRTMSGGEYVIAVSDWELTDALFHFAAHALGVDWERIHLALNYQPLGHTASVGSLLPELEKAEHVIHVLIKDMAPIWSSLPFVLIGQPRYGSGITAVDGW